MTTKTTSVPATSRFGTRTPRRRNPSREVLILQASMLTQGEFPHARKWVPARGLKEKTGHAIEILLDSVA